MPTEPRFVVDEHGRRVAVILPIEEYEGLIRPLDRPRRRRCHTFSDLSGKLKWQGDALAAQRVMRDEW